MSLQKTIEREVGIAGRGLFTGFEVNVRFKPAAPNAGVHFIRCDQPDPVRIPARIDHLTKRSRRSSLRNGTVSIETIEHCLAAICALGIDNIDVELDNAELPGVDGSSKPYIDSLTEAGIVEQDSPRRTIQIYESTHVRDGDAELVAWPGESDRLEILYELESDDAAAKLIENWIEQDSRTIEKRIWLLLVYCYEQQNLAKQATATLQRASRLTPWPEMDLQLADRHWKTGDFAATYEDIMRAMKKGPVAKPADAWTLAAAAAISLKRIDDAAHAAKEARAAGADPIKIERLEKSVEQLRKRLPPDPEASDHSSRNASKTVGAGFASPP